MYDQPGCTKMHMSVETIKKAKDMGAVGVKDSSGDMSYHIALIHEFKHSSDFCILTGTELFLPETIFHGGHGAVPGGANIFPKLFVDLYNASVKRDFEKVELLHEVVIALNNSIYSVTRGNSRILKGIKSSLKIMNICNDYIAMPLRSHSKEERLKVEHYLRALKEMMK
jgi:2-dehydro-3-deoxy-D-pentonate aldolase